MMQAQIGGGWAGWYAAAPVSLMVTLAVLVAAAASFVAGRARAAASVEGERAQLHSLPSYHGYFVAWCVALPALGVLIGYGVFGGAAADAILKLSLPADILALPDERLDLFLRDARALAFGGLASTRTAALEDAAAALLRIDTVATSIAAIVALAAAGIGFGVAMSRVGARFRARNAVEGLVIAALVACSVIAVLTTVGIVASLLFEAGRFFSMTMTAEAPFAGLAEADGWLGMVLAWLDGARVWTLSYLGSIRDFLFGLHWSPQIAIRADQIGQTGAFGAAPLFYGTLMITAIAMLVAAPIGLNAAIFLSEYAGAGARAWVKPLLEILAGVPTVVYGYFAALTVAPAVRAAAAWVGFEAPAQSAFAAGAVMGVMIIPFVSSLSDDVINAVPQSLRDGALALGATRSETIRQVVLPAALPGIMGALLLAVSRAVGETMIVVMAAGQAARITLNPLQDVTTVTVQIVALLTGDTAFDNPKTLSAFALGLVLFLVTLAMNVIALRVVRAYRERYE